MTSTILLFAAVFICYCAVSVWSVGTPFQEQVAIQVDDSFTAYVDGVETTKGDTSWKVYYLTVNTSARLLAIDAQDFRGEYFINVTSRIISTTPEYDWKCVAFTQPNTTEWSKRDYNDNNWPKAIHRNEQSRNDSTIWAEGATGGSRVLCRGRIDPDDCLDSPCLNNGRCMDDIYKYTCNCSKGFTGLRCETVQTQSATVPVVVSLCLGAGVIVIAIVMLYKYRKRIYMKQQPRVPITFERQDPQENIYQTNDCNEDEISFRSSPQTSMGIPIRNSVSNQPSPRSYSNAISGHPVYAQAQKVAKSNRHVSQSIPTYAVVSKPKGRGEHTKAHSSDHTPGEETGTQFSPIYAEVCKPKTNLSDSRNPGCDKTRTKEVSKHGSQSTPMYEVVCKPGGKGDNPKISLNDRDYENIGDTLTPVHPMSTNREGVTREIDSSHVEYYNYTGRGSDLGRDGDELVMVDNELYATN